VSTRLSSRKRSEQFLRNTDWSYHHVNICIKRLEKQFRAVHYTKYIIAHQSGSQFTTSIFYIHSFHIPDILNSVVCFLLGNSPASEFYMHTFRNILFHLYRRRGILIFYIYRCFILLFNLEFEPKTIWFVNVEWLRHILIVFVFLFSPTWRRPHGWPKNIGDLYAQKFIYSMEKNPSLKANLFSVSQEIPAFLKPEGSLLDLQVPANCPYSEPARSSPCPHIPLSKDPA
jgi:hypothetical protein